MQTKIEGIVLSKTLFKERDIIASLLLRSGKKVSVLFPGGAGGGKNKKSSMIELGHMLKIELRRSRGDLYGAKEWKIIWEAKKIRLNHQAFFLVCFFLEAIKGISFGEDLRDDNFRFDANSEGNFRVLSNALFHLDKDLEKGPAELSRHFTLFLTKILLEQGLFPVLNECICCGAKSEGVQLMPNQGGFACSQCASGGSDARALFNSLIIASQLSYKEFEKLTPLDQSSRELLFSYFCYNFQLSKETFKSYQML